MKSVAVSVRASFVCTIYSTSPCVYLNKVAKIHMQKAVYYIDNVIDPDSCNSVVPLKVVYIFMPLKDQALVVSRIWARKLC